MCRRPAHHDRRMCAVRAAGRQDVRVPDGPAHDIATEKALARAALLRARSERAREPHENERRTDALLRLTAGAGTVAAYVSYGTEPSTASALTAWLERGTR